MAYIRSKTFCADKVQYPDGIGCCIWHPFPGDEEHGLAWDFAYDDIDELIALLYDLKAMPADIYEDTDENGDPVS